MTLTTGNNNTPQLQPQHPYMMNHPMNSNYPVLQGSSALPSAGGNNNPMVQLPVLPHQHQTHPSLQGGATLYSQPQFNQQQQQQPQFIANNQPLPPVQFISNNQQQQQMMQQAMMMQQAEQQRQSQQYTTTTITTTTTETPVVQNGGAAQVSSEDASLRMAGQSVAKQMWTKFKSRVRSPTALIGSLCNMLAMSLLFEAITIIVLASGYYVPVYLHVVFWIMLLLQTVTMILKSPILMVINFLLNFTCFIMSIVAASSTYRGQTGLGICIALFLYSTMFCVRLSVRYLIKVNAKKLAAIDVENGQQVSPSNAEVLESHNPVLALLDSLKKNQKFVMEYKLSDLLIGAE